MIILESSDFIKIKIDKGEHKITEISRLEKNTNRDVTKDCIKEELKYTTGGVKQCTPYTLGAIMSKLLNNTPDLQCRNSLLHTFDKIILKN